MSFIPDKSPARIDPGKALEPAGTSPQPQKDFGSYMQGAEKSAQRQVQGASQGPSPMSIARGDQLPGTPPTMDAIAAQAKSVQDGLGTVGKQLKTPNLTFKRSQAHLLKNKLSDANGYIRQAGGKLGMEFPPPTLPTTGGPIGKFLGYINDGQNQLIQVQQKLKEMSSKGHQLNAAEMLSVTVKMNLAQQEIEYSTTLLGKVIDSVKQIMNIQL